MKLGHLRFESPLTSMLLAVLAILVICVGPACAAPEPGTVTIVLAGEPEGLDPGNTTNSLEGQVSMQNILETLTYTDPEDGSVVPKLATSWKQIDKNTWHFFLRKGVKFHDGADFNAEAVIYALKRLYNKDKLVSRVRSKFFLTFTLECKALDSHTLELKTSTPQPLMPTLMGTMGVCSPRTPFDKETRQPVGTGPYRFVKWDAGTQIITERFDAYWGKQPQVKKAVYIWRTETAVEAAMVAIGEADLAPNIAAQDVTRPDMDKSYPNAETTFLRIGGAWYPPLNDRRVRLALNLAIDKDAIRGSIMSKDVVPAAQVVGPSVPGFNPDLKPWPYDPKRARQLLDEARKDGVPVDREILLAGRIGIYPGADEIMEAALNMYKAVGLNVRLKMMERGVLRTYDNKPFPKDAGPYLVQKQHDNNMGDAGFSAFTNFACEGTSSSTCEKAVDELIAKGEAATGEERKKIWQALFKRVHEDIIPNVMLFHMVGFCRVGNRINFKPNVKTIAEIPLAQITFK
jgi:peptide/nickel transport system substrate-binding protein